MGWIPRWGSLWMVHPFVSAPNFVSVTPSTGSKKGRSLHTLIFVLLEFHVFCKSPVGFAEGGRGRGIMSSRPTWATHFFFSILRYDKHMAFYHRQREIALMPS
jgi:hypothetical protein